MLKKSREIIGFNYCEQIYKLEKEIRESYSSDENYYDTRFKIRSKQLAPIIDDFIEYVEREIKAALPRSPLGEGLDYAKKHLAGLKNFLFANTAKGATLSANIYSIVETAKTNKLVVERYLVYLFDNL